MATITFSGTGSHADWNVAGNWTGGVLPASTDTASLAGPATNVFLTGTPVTIASVTLTTQDLFVGGSAIGGGTGAGSLAATGGIAVSGGHNLVSVDGSTITATGGFSLAAANDALGGGGTFNGPITNAGVVRADGEFFGLGPLIVNGAISGPGGIEIYAGSSLQLNGATAETVVVDNLNGDPAGTGTLALGTPGSFTGAISIAAGNTLDLVLTGQTITSAAFNTPGTLTVAAGGTTENFLVSGASGASFSGSSLTVGQGVVCFARGTRIATPTGAVAVEDLSDGDVVLTARGEEQAITWIGRRRVDCRRHPEPRQVWPVRIRAGAFGPALPARDLYVSPQHAIYDQGVLIPARLLVNGRTITQKHVARVEYFHIELARHDILLAEGLPAESYLDTGDRATFENAGGAIVLHPDFSRWAWDARACAELKVTGPELDVVRAKLAQRAEAIGERAAAAV
jgi:collagen type I alpha